MRKFKAKALLATAVLALAALPVLGAGFLDKLYSGKVVTAQVTAVNTDPVLLVKYVGTDAVASLTIESDGNLTFKQGATAIASTELECPVSGALGGIIDVSDAACDTFVEVLNVINASTSWRAFPLGALGTDSSDNALKDLAESKVVMSREGLALAGETATFGADVTVSVYLSQFNSAVDFLGGGSGGTAGVPFKNPYQDRQLALQFLSSTVTDTGRSKLYSIYSVKPNFNKDRTYSEVVSLLYTTTDATAADASTVTLNPTTLGPYGLLAKAGEKLIVRVKGATTLTAPAIYVTALDFEFRK